MRVTPDLIERARERDTAAFNQIVLTYRKRVVGTIARMIPRPEDAEDIAQEVFTRLYFTFDRLRTPKVFELWLHRMTVNAAYSYLRRRRSCRESRISDLSERQVAFADAIAGRRLDRDGQYDTKIRDLVEELLGAVSEADRVLLVLKEVEGLSLRELEEVYRVSENALKVRLYRARQRVLKSLNPPPVRAPVVARARPVAISAV
jgi:RNA polymerase sigma-70 factor (ECF subfamily)